MKQSAWRRWMELELRSITAVDVTGKRANGWHPQAQRLERAVRRILKDNVLCAMSTIASSGQAHINTAYFAWSEALELFFLSHPGSLHCGNLRKRPTMAMAVFSTAQEWGGPDCGLQLFGTCRETRGAAASHAEQEYARRFPAYWKWKAEEWPADREWELRFYRFTPRRLKIFDEREFRRMPWVTAAVRRNPRQAR